MVHVYVNFHITQGDLNTGLLRGLSGKKKKKSPWQAKDTGLIPGQEEPLEKEVGTHASILAWEIPWTEEPGRPQSMALQKSWT